MLNIEKYKDDILNVNSTDLTCSVHDKFLNLSHISCDGNCKECKKNVMEWLLDEYKEPILEEAEKAYLSAVIKPFKANVTGICKLCIYIGFYCIRIYAESISSKLETEVIYLPLFEKVQCTKVWILINIIH
jgi:hypothetical protein